ncbi:MAG: hypothetical protein ABFE07_23025 [Armatimonadia bacterium]
MTQTREQLLAARDAIDAQIKALDAEPERAEEEVLPCPFCGGKAVWREYDERYPSDAYGLIVDHAQDCFLSFHRSFDIGRKAWGERATLSRVPVAAWPGEDELRELRQALVNHNDVLRSAHAVAARRGADTNWDTFSPRIGSVLAFHHETVSAARNALLEEASDRILGEQP